jgi:HK97 family phage prohead protease
MAIEYRDQKASAPAVSDDGLSLTGRAVPFDQETQIGSPPWGFKEKISRNAFNKYFKEGDTTLLSQHDSRLPVARTSAGTLTLTKRNGALEWDSEPTSRASYIADVMENVRAGNYGGCSIGFECVRDVWTDDDGKESDRYDGTHREVLEAKLPEVSIVTFPAYKDTNVQQNHDTILGERRAAYEAAQRSLLEEREERATTSTCDGKCCDNCGVKRSEELPSGASDQAPAQGDASEPVTTTRESDGYETALRIEKFNANRRRMSDLEE